jgi:hypothetical protein
MTSTLDAWDAQLARAGAPLLAGRMRLVAALRPHLTAAYEAVSGGPPGEASGMNYRSSALENSDEFDEIGALETALLKALSGFGPASSTGASAWSARTGTSSSWLSAACPPAGTPATVNPGRSRSRCGWPASRCSGRAVRTRC